MTLPTQRDQLLLLLSRVLDAIVASNRLRQWLRYRLDEELRCWDFVQEQALDGDEEFEHLAGCGITHGDPHAMIAELTAGRQRYWDEIQRYLSPLRPPAEEMYKILHDWFRGSPLEKRALTVQAVYVFLQQMDREHDQVVRLRGSIEAVLDPQKSKAERQRQLLQRLKELMVEHDIRKRWPHQCWKKLAEFANGDAFIREELRVEVTKEQVRRMLQPH